MILEAASELGIDLARSYMVGDRKGDVDAGRAAGCTTVFIDLGYAEPAPDRPDHVVRSIAEAANVILEAALTVQEAS
jgi:D-glycero-D-manno-heptose 1,7-bisphosphate phosphatase